MRIERRTPEQHTRYLVRDGHAPQACWHHQQSNVNNQLHPLDCALIRKVITICACGEYVTLHRPSAKAYLILTTFDDIFRHLPHYSTFNDKIRTTQTPPHLYEDRGSWWIGGDRSEWNFQHACKVPCMFLIITFTTMNTWVLNHCWKSMILGLHHKKTGSTQNEAFGAVHVVGGPCLSEIRVDQSTTNDEFLQAYLHLACALTWLPIHWVKVKDPRNTPAG